MQKCSLAIPSKCFFIAQEEPLYSLFFAFKVGEFPVKSRSAVIKIQQLHYRPFKVSVKAKIQLNPSIEFCQSFD